MEKLFYKLDIRNIKIDQWDVSNVKTMRNMFWNCSNFNADLSKWDVRNVVNMERMFFLLYKFYIRSINVACFECKIYD